MEACEEKILNALLDSYENSLLFRGENKIAIHIDFKFSKKTMPEYFNESSLSYEDIHTCLKDLERRQFLTIVWRQGKENHIVQKVILNETMADQIYSYVNRMPRTEIDCRCMELLRVLSAACKTPAAAGLVADLIQRIQKGKSVKEFIDPADTEAVCSRIWKRESCARWMPSTVQYAASGKKTCANALQ